MIINQINSLLTNEKSLHITPEIKKIEMLGYSTLIMAVDKDDKYKKGFINLTKFVNDFQSKNPSESVKQIRDWKNNKEAKEQISRQGNSLYGNFSLKIQGGSNKDIQGTYFHPDLVLKVLMWANTKLSQQMEKIINETIYSLTLQVQQIPVLKQQLQHQTQEIQQLKSNIQQEQELLETRLKTNDLNINGVVLKMYNGIQFPLFEAKQVLIELLGYNNLGECRFYKDNKKNFDFVQKIQNQPKGNLPHGVWGNNQYSNSTIFLTEFGLYECLFTSNKPFASEFRLQVMKLLRDIRLGNIKLDVIKECEFTNIIQEKNSELMQMITKMSNISKQLEDLKGQVESLQDDNIQLNNKLSSCKKICSLYKQKVINENTGLVDKQYGGSSIDPIRRNKQHRSNSSNRELRKAINKGQQVEFELVETFEYYTENERKQKERDLILKIPIEQRLNIQLPRVRI